MRPMLNHDQNIDMVYGSGSVFRSDDPGLRMGLGLDQGLGVQLNLSEGLGLRASGTTPGSRSGRSGSESWS